MASERTLARPYAKAVFELAEETGALAQWSEMVGLAAMIAADPQLRMHMKDPHFSSNERAAIFLEIGAEHFTSPMQAFIRLLGKFKRLPLLPAIAVLYEEMKAHAERVIVVKLISAFPMDQAEQQVFSDKLKQRMRANVLLACETDERIIGGAIIQTGDTVIDGSIRGRLNKLADSVGILN